MGQSSSKPDPLHYAALIAHQLQSPLNGVSAHLMSLLGEYAGPVPPRQRRLLEKAQDRCNEAVASVRRMLTIVRTMDDPGQARGVSEVVRMLHRAEARYHHEAAKHHIAFSRQIDVHRAWVPMLEPVLEEVLHALVVNALKYTPAHGRVRVSVGEHPNRSLIRITVADSGIGIPESERSKVFEPFYRSGAAKASARPGAGLGLALVKTAVEAVDGTVEIETSDLGGTGFVLSLPVCDPAELDDCEPNGVESAMKVVIIGGVAAGPKVASKIIRLEPTAEVTVIEKGEFLSYAGCGLPYYVSGVVKEQAELMSTPVGVVRDPVFFQKVKNVHVLNHTEALEIDRKGKRVRVRNGLDDDEMWLEYDKLMLATGAAPFVPPIPGVDLDNVFTLHGVGDAEGVKSQLAEGKAKDVVIVGGGLIGVEMTEALAEHGCRVTIVEMLPQILAMLDWEMARLVEQHLESHGVKVLTNTRLESIEGDTKVTGVVTDKGRFAAEMVIMSVGVRPNVKLAEQAGLEIGPTRAIKVDDHMRTSDPDIYAAGDCVECVDLITGAPCYVPLGSTANKQGRVAAQNICGREDSFPGVLGSTVCKVFDFCVARTGLTEEAARKAGYDVVTAMAPAPDKAHFMPTAKPLLLKLIVDKNTRRLLGAEATGPGAGDKRIDVAAMAITGGMTVDQLANADLSYAPPYAPAMDNIITAANVARNKLDGQMTGISSAEVKEKLDRGDDFVLLDVRSPAEVELMRLPSSTNIPLGALRARAGELPKDKEIVAFCKISLRGYEAALILKAAGFENVKVMDGGIAMWPYEKLQ